MYSFVFFFCRIIHFILCVTSLLLLRLVSPASGTPWGGLSKIINQSDTLKMQGLCTTTIPSCPTVSILFLAVSPPGWEDKASEAFNFNAPERQDWRLIDRGLKTAAWLAGWKTRGLAGWLVGDATRSAANTKGWDADTLPESWQQPFRHCQPTDEGTERRSSLSTLRIE